MAEWAAAPTAVALADINCSERKTKQKPDILSRPPQSGIWPRKRAITVLLKPNSKVTLTSLLSESAINHCNWERRTRNGGNGSTLNNACGVCGEWFTVKTSPETKWKLSSVALRAIIHMSAMYSVFHTATCWGKTNGKRWRRNLVFFSLSYCFNRWHLTCISAPWWAAVLGGASQWRKKLFVSFVLYSSASEEMSSSFDQADHCSIQADRHTHTHTRPRTRFTMQHPDWHWYYYKPAAASCSCHGWALAVAPPPLPQITLIGPIML